MTGILDAPAPLQDCDGLIDPSAFPIPTTDHVELRNQASALRKAGKGVAETGEDIVSTWGGLSACYTAPESEDLLGALAPVSANGSDVESGTDRAAGALEDFADEVREIKMEWNDLRNRAAAFRERMLSEEDWKKSDHWFTSTSSNVEKSNAYRDEALALIKWYERAQRICANTISRGIAGRTVFVRGSSSQATTNPDAFVFDTIDTDADIPSVWGEPGTADQYWHQDALDAVWDFGVDAVQGTGAMLGMHSSEGWFEMSWGDALKEYHWDNLTSAASLIGMYDAETDSLGWSGTDTIHGAWRDLAHSVVPWEEWGDRPGYVIGTAALNVVGLVGGAALTATGVGAVVGVPLMAWRGMSIVDGMGGSGSRGGSGDGVETNISSPSMNLPNFGGNGSPVANLNFDSSDLSGFDPRQVSEIGASLERLYNSQQSSGTGSGETAGGGRPSPSRPIGQDRSETSGPERRPAEDPRVDDMLTFEDIVNHPDNATLGDRLRTENQRALDQVDRDNKTRSNDTPASDEGTWTAREIIDGPEGDRSRVLTPAGGGHNDTFDASAANRPPSSPLHARADGIDGTGSGRGPGNEASDNNRGGDHGANMSDRSPTAHNQDGSGNHSGTPGGTQGNTGGNNTSSTYENSTRNSSQEAGETPRDQSESTTGTINDPNNTSGGQPRNSNFHSQDPLKTKWTKTRTVEESGPAGHGVNEGAKPVLPDHQLKKTSITKDNGGLSPHPEEIFGDKKNLEPNTKYKVDDNEGNHRGEYTTDANGDIRRIVLDAHYTQKSHPELSNPRPNVEYVINTRNGQHIYETNSYGRNLTVEGRLAEDRSPRIKSEERAVTKNAKDYYKAYNKLLMEDFHQNPEKYPGLTEPPKFVAETWNGGHVIGIGEYGGIPEKLNQVPMVDHVNRHYKNDWSLESSYRNFEQSMHDVLKGKFSLLEERSNDPKYRAQVDLWERSVAQGPPPPDIQARVSQVYDPSLPTFEIRNSTGKLIEVLDAPPSAIIVDYTINGIAQQQISIPNLADYK
ncbi:DNA/RNA non-specific endonuclease [Nocardiopsis alba]|uniref:hypothetical protein n=1 Tax=Nocardiopsis alba TaxID=53437 RepID=UPI003630878D